LERGASGGTDGEGWESSPSIGRSSGKGGSLKSRRVPAASKVGAAADDDDWGQNW
jgi:hypothetical protein